MLPLMMRAAFFTLVGVAFFVFWVLADPSYEETASQSERKWVLAFSGVLLLLAFALPMLAQLVGERVVFRVSLVPAAGVALSSFANILEDGLQLEWVFYVFVLGSAIQLLGNLALTAAIAFVGRGGFRLLAVVPAGTVAAIILFVVAGGPIMLATWLTAAAVALALPKRAAAQAAPATP